ncbi:2TM domain-containing protein [Nonomuraea sp. PA05]|uniref:2TM domain-containing protein n=1 Tax=Nonomuraea sp. PA05 TaxID=2604466 RepID=UPI0011D788BC|nr:2TM domain-containing protein [Nonomuraea sp. PA05]TYB69299.1 2TM domain-containing protein [Nonomuraea sp. PA05]
MKTQKSEAARKWGLRIHVLFYVLSNLAQVVVWVLYDSGSHFWPLWSIVFWGIGLIFHVWSNYSPPRSHIAH